MDGWSQNSLKDCLQQLKFVCERGESSFQEKSFSKDFKTLAQLQITKITHKNVLKQEPAGTIDTLFRRS